MLLKNGKLLFDIQVCQISESSITTAYTGMGSANSATWKVADDGNITISYRCECIF